MAAASGPSLSIRFSPAAGGGIVGTTGGSSARFDTARRRSTDDLMGRSVPPLVGLATVGYAATAAAPSAAGGGPAHPARKRRGGRVRTHNYRLTIQTVSSRYTTLVQPWPRGGCRRGRRKRKPGLAAGKGRRKATDLSDGQSGGAGACVYSICSRRVFSSCQKRRPKVHGVAPFNSATPLATPIPSRPTRPRRNGKCTVPNPPYKEASGTM